MQVVSAVQVIFLLIGVVIQVMFFGEAVMGKFLSTSERKSPVGLIYRTRLSNTLAMTPSHRYAAEDSVDIRC